jgi:hypothetical protein
VNVFADEFVGAVGGLRRLGVGDIEVVGEDSIVFGMGSMRENILGTCFILPSYFLVVWGAI